MAATERRARAGYSLMEMLIVLAIMALATAIVAPAGMALRDQIMAHTVQYEFQRAMSALRRDAYRSETATIVRGSTATRDDVPASRAVILQTGWTYRLDRPVAISAGGACSQATVDVLKDGRVAMRFKTADDACHFIRLR